METRYIIESTCGQDRGDNTLWVDKKMNLSTYEQAKAVLDELRATHDKIYRFRLVRQFREVVA